MAPAGNCRVNGYLDGPYGINGAYGTCTSVSRFQIIVYCPGGMNSLGQIVGPGGRSGARCPNNAIMRATGPSFNTW